MFRFENQDTNTEIPGINYLHKNSLNTIKKSHQIVCTIWAEEKSILLGLISFMLMVMAALYLIFGSESLQYGYFIALLVIISGL